MAEPNLTTEEVAKVAMGDSLKISRWHVWIVYLTDLVYQGGQTGFGSGGYGISVEQGFTKSSLRPRSAVALFERPLTDCWQVFVV